MGMTQGVSRIRSEINEVFALGRKVEIDMLIFQATLFRFSVKHG